MYSVKPGHDRAEKFLIKGLNKGFLSNRFGSRYEPMTDIKVRLHIDDGDLSMIHHEISVPIGW